MSKARELSKLPDYVLSIGGGYTHPSTDGNLHVPATGTTNSGKVLTAGGTAGALSWVTPAATGVTAVSGTAPVVSSGGNTPAISMAAASSGVNGYMTGAYATKLDGVAASANNYSLPTGSSTVIGGTKLFSDVVQSVAANAVSTTASKSYGLQLNASGQLVVNVPWTDVDTNTFPTTYAWTAGTTAGPTGSITGTSSTISVGAVPSASATESGIVTTGAQTFAGAKTLTSPVLVTPSIGVATGTSFNSITGLASVVSPVDGVAAVGVSSTVARQDHVHPSDTSRAPTESPTLTGTPTAPTASAGTNTTQIATTAFVQAEIANDTFSKTELMMAIGNINSPLLSMPLKSSIDYEIGEGTATFIRASTATYVNRYGVLKTAGVDEPRFEKEGYLSEGASTNLLTYSEQFDNTVWAKNGVTVAVNTIETLDPYGTNLADKLVNSGGVVNVIQANSVVIASATNDYTFSFFVKQGNAPAVTWNAYYQDGTEYNIHFQFSTKTFTGTPAGSNPTYSEYANGWYRISCNIPRDATGIRTQVISRIWVDRIHATIGDYCYIFGAQLEALPFASSYIPTVASVVTRSADVLSVTALGHVGLHSDAITMIADFDSMGQKPSTYPKAIYISNTIDANANVQLLTGFGGVQASYIYKNPTGSATYITVPKTKYRICGSWTPTSGSFYMNGILIDSKLFPSTSHQLNNIYIGHADNFGHVSNVRIYDKALTTQEVALS